jgi:hypothetical protein
MLRSVNAIIHATMCIGLYVADENKCETKRETKREMDQVLRGVPRPCQTKRTIRNVDSTCGFVCVYQIIQKTGLYSLINQDLRTAIDQATAAGRFEVSHCVRLPKAVRNAYESTSGEPFSNSGSICPFYLLEAIFETSQGVNGQLVQMQMKLPSMTDLDAAVAQCTATKEEHNDDDEFVDAVDTIYEGHWHSLHGYDTSPIDLSTHNWTLVKWLIPQEEGGFQRDPLDVDDFTALLKVLSDKRHSIRAGYIIWQASESVHAVAFVMCRGDPIFYNWGKTLTGKEATRLIEGNEDDRKKVLSFFFNVWWENAEIKTVALMWERDPAPASLMADAVVDVKAFVGWNDWIMG